VDNERVGFIFVHMHQGEIAISAFVFGRRITHWRRRGYRFNERRRNDLECPLWKSGHCCKKFKNRAIANFNLSEPAMRSVN
jgi:hypothetical protein